MPITGAGKISERMGFSGFTLFYPLPKRPPDHHWRQDTGLGGGGCPPAPLLPRVEIGKEVEAQ